MVCLLDINHVLNESLAVSIPSEIIISASNKPALERVDKSKTISPWPSPVEVKVAPTFSEFTDALKLKSVSTLSTSENVTENVGLFSKIRWSLSKFNFESNDICGKSFTELTVIVTVLFLVMLFSTAVTE